MEPHLYFEQEKNLQRRIDRGDNNHDLIVLLFAIVSRRKAGAFGRFTTFEDSF